MLIWNERWIRSRQPCHTFPYFTGVVPDNLTALFLIENYNIWLSLLSQGNIKHASQHSTKKNTEVSLRDTVTWSFQTGRNYVNSCACLLWHVTSSWVQLVHPTEIQHQFFCDIREHLTERFSLSWHCRRTKWHRLRVLTSNYLCFPSI